MRSYATSYHETKEEEGVRFIAYRLYIQSRSSGQPFPCRTPSAAEAAVQGENSCAVNKIAWFQTEGHRWVGVLRTVGGDNGETCGKQSGIVAIILVVRRCAIFNATKTTTNGRFPARLSQRMTITGASAQWFPTSKFPTQLQVLTYIFRWPSPTRLC